MEGNITYKNKAVECLAELLDKSIILAPVDYVFADIARIELPISWDIKNYLNKSVFATFGDLDELVISRSNDFFSKVGGDFHYMSLYSHNCTSYDGTSYTYCYTYIFSKTKITHAIGNKVSILLDNKEIYLDSYWS